MASVLACLVLGALLVAAGALKLADPAGARAALAGTYGLRRPELAFGALVAAETGLGVLIATGIDLAAFAGALLFAESVIAAALRRRPCRASPAEAPSPVRRAGAASRSLRPAGS